MKVFRIKKRSQAEFQAGVAALEAQAHYPLGQDSFQLDHGEDYFAFFNRLGALHYYAAQVPGPPAEIVAVGAGVIRRVPFRDGQSPKGTWYLCDLKVRPDHRGSHLPLRILTRAFPHNYLRCPRGYGISMNPPDRPNRIVRLLARFRWAKTALACELGIYSWDSETMARNRALLERHRGPVTFLSLHGKKDLILGSTGKPLPLVHAQFGPCADPQGRPELSPGATHMFCAPLLAQDPLWQELAALGLKPSATASVIHHRMKDSDWRFILTSDI